MKLTKFLPVPLMVAAFAFIWMALAAKLSLLSWVAFITWGGYFLAGISSKSAIREAVSFTLGIALGAAIVLIGAVLSVSLGGYTFPIIVALAAFAIVLLELAPWFDMAPGYFLGAAAFFGAGGKPDTATMLAVWIPGILGLVLGILSGYFRGVIFSAERMKDPLRK